MPRLSVLGFVLLGAVFVRAQDAPNPAVAPAPAEPEVVDNDTSPYHQALIAYKNGKFDEARTAIDAAEKATPGDLAIEVLKSRILTEQHDYTGGEKILRAILTPTGPFEVQLALGDLLLRKHSYERAAKYYTLALQSKPKDPDLTLKMVYAKVGASDMIAAGQYASHLAPLDPKNPYDDHASYYFAKAALARAVNNSTEEDSEIQNARTIYGITVTNRYLKFYLEVFGASEANPNADLTPEPLVKPAPSGKQ